MDVIVSYVVLTLASLYQVYYSTTVSQTVCRSFMPFLALFQEAAATLYLVVCNLARPGAIGGRRAMHLLAC